MLTKMREWFSLYAQYQSEEWRNEDVPCQQNRNRQPTEGIKKKLKKVVIIFCLNSNSLQWT